MRINFIKNAKEGIQKLIPYEPGKPIEEVARELGINPSDIVKLASNENPYGPSPTVRQVLDRAGGDLSRYPDGNAFEARQALANHVNVDIEQITLGNGSDELLRLVALAYSGPGDEIVYSRYGFAVYPIATLTAGATPVETPDKNYGHDLSAMAKAINEKTRIVYIANPNNPTGTWLADEEILTFLQKVPLRVLVVLDEAYIEYLEKADVTKASVWIKKHPSLIITRTFSKAYGLAGLRAGYAIANPEVTDIINRIRPAFNVGNITQKAIMAALEDQGFVQQAQKANREGLVQLERAMELLDLSYIPSRANFITVNINGSGREIFKRLLSMGIIVRPLSGYNMDEYIRISVGLPEENQRFIEAMNRLVEQDCETKGANR